MHYDKPKCKKCPHQYQSILSVPCKRCKGRDGFGPYDTSAAPAVNTFKGEGGTHYKQDRIVETFLLMEQVASNVHDKTSDIKKALWAAMAMKHLDRVGTKDDVNGELLKAENYLHRARTGQWMDK